MAAPLDIRTHPNFSIEELLALTGWRCPTPLHRENMRRALDYFQEKVPRPFLREAHYDGPFSFAVNGTKIRLLNWMLGIDFGRPVDVQRRVNRGDPLIAFKDPSIRAGKEWGAWYTFPSTRQELVAIHGTQTRLHKFKARSAFHGMQSTVSDAYVGWFPDRPAQYRHGGGQQLFIWDAAQHLEPA